MRKVKTLYSTRGVDPYHAHPVHWDVACQKTEGGARIWCNKIMPNGIEHNFILHWSVGTTSYMIGDDADFLRKNHPDFFLELNSPVISEKLIKLLWAD